MVTVASFLAASTIWVRSARWNGRGYLAGTAPAAPAPDEPDGRLKMMNVPARGRIAIFERSTLTPIEETLSRPDGTWRVGGLDPSIEFFVIGFDDRGLVNAAIQDWVRPFVPEP